MAYKISGTKSETARIMILKESDWSIESNTVISGSGAYEVDGLETGVKTAFSRAEDGEILGFGSVTPIESGEAVVPKELWSWGRNTSGQLGNGNIVNLSLPEQVGSDTDWSDVSSGMYHSVTVKTDGTLWAWGGNGNGELGLGDTTPRSSPVQVGTDEDWSVVGDSKNHVLAIKTNGKLYAWGLNNWGQLGLGDSGNKYSSPVQVGTDEDWSDVAPAGLHTIASKTNGKLYSWGAGNSGELGQGPTISGVQPNPGQIGSDTDWSYISAGDGNSTAIKTDGTLWTWGENFNGQLGLGDSGGGTERFSPTKVGTDEDWSEVEISDFCGAVKTGGTLWTWGKNAQGQLGQGDFNVHRSSPTQVGIDEDWSVVDVSQNWHMAAIKTGGTLWAWGNNDYGQLGQGNTTDYSSPVQVGTDEDWSGVDCGFYHILGLKTV